MASRAAVEPRIRLLTVFMITSKLLFGHRRIQIPQDDPSCPSRKTASVASRHRTHPHHARDFSETSVTGRSSNPRRHEELCLRRFCNENSLFDQVTEWPDDVS